MFLSPEILLYLIGGFMAAWGVSLIYRTRATRRVAANRCAECARPWQGPEPTCPRCGSQRARQAERTLTRPAVWGAIGAVIAVAGLASPGWQRLVISWYYDSSTSLTGVGFLGASGIVLVVVGGLALTLGLVGDPAGDRTRCRRCWYPMPPLGDPPAPATCPECGKVATKHRDLSRTRRKPRLIIPGLFACLLAQLGWYDQAVRRSGPVRLVPTPVLIESLGIIPGEWIDGSTPSRARGNYYALNDYSLMGRLNRQALSDDQRARLCTVIAREIPAQSHLADACRLLTLLELASTPRIPESRSLTYSDEAILTLRPSVLTATRLHTIPALDAAYAHALALAIRDLSDNRGERAEAAATWLGAEFDRVVQYAGPMRLAAPPSQIAIESAAEDLRRHLAGPDDHRAAVAAVLLASIGALADADLRRLGALISSPEPLVARLAEGALLAEALESEPALLMWTRAQQPRVSATPTSGQFGFAVGTLFFEDPSLLHAAAAMRLQRSPELGTAAVDLMGQTGIQGVLVGFAAAVGPCNPAFTDGVIDRLVARPMDAELWSALTLVDRDPAHRCGEFVGLLSNAMPFHVQVRLVDRLVRASRSNPGALRPHVEALRAFQQTYERGREAIVSGHPLSRLWHDVDTILRTLEEMP